MLQIEDLHIFYGRTEIIRGVSLAISSGQVVCLLGRNGAGKTTILRGIMGLTPPASGSILFMGDEIVGKAPHQICLLGVGFVPQGRRVFAGLTLQEHLEVADRGHDRNGWTREKIFELLPELERLRNHKAKNLSGGEQQMLSIARALMTNPKLLLMDEPTGGLAPLVQSRLEEFLRDAVSEGLSVLLAEQNIRFALNVSRRGYIIDRGLVRFQGDVSSMMEDKELVGRYLAV